MATFTLALKSRESRFTDGVVISKYDDGSESRRARHSAIKQKMKCKSPKLTQAKAQQYKDFFVARTGSAEGFDIEDEFETTFKARFESESFKIIREGGYYICEFEVVEINADEA